MDRLHRPQCDTVGADFLALSCSAPISDYYRLGRFGVVGEIMGHLCGLALLYCLRDVLSLLYDHYLSLPAVLDWGKNGRCTLFAANQTASCTGFVANQTVTYTLFLANQTSKMTLI